MEVCEEGRPAGEGASGEGASVAGIVRVNDTGAGIPADKLEKIFERFYRLEKSRSKELGGIDWAPAIAKHAALYHGGEVSWKARKMSVLLYGASTHRLTKISRNSKKQG